MLNGTNITINNVVGDKDYLKSTHEEIGFMWYKRDKRYGGIKYDIKLAELNTIEFSPELLQLSQLIYSGYLNSLNVSFSPEVLTVLVLLHEMGYVEYWETFIEISNSESSIETLNSYALCMSGLYDYMAKPWYFRDLCEINIYQIMFNPIETYPELFSFKHFPRFLKLLRNYNLCKG